jgi:hypothetical protein
MTEEKKADPLLEGFRQPPERVTEPCLTYMTRTMELRDFISFYFSFVKTSQKLGNLIPDEAKTAAGAKELTVLKYNYMGQRSLVNQIMLSRAVESFDLYLTTILRDVFLSRPEILKSDGVVDIATVIETGNYQDLIWQIVERKVHDLSYKPLSELRKFIQRRTGIDLFPQPDAFDTAMVASEIRNLIAHNDCVVNGVFKARTKKISIPLEISERGRINIDDAWLRCASYTLDGIVFRFDELATEKFKLHTLSSNMTALSRR